MNDEKPQNAADGTALKESAKKEKRLSYQEKDDWKKTVESDFSRRTLMRLLTYCGYGKSVLSADPKVHYLIGKEDVAKYMVARIKNLLGEEAVFAILREEKLMETVANG